MTRNNLDEHLSWLLQTKATIPPTESTLPAVALSFTSASIDSALPSQDDIEAAQPSQGVVEAPQASQALELANMARLRTAPASVAKPSLISIGPRFPEVASPLDHGTPSAKHVAASAYSTAQTTLAQTPVKRISGTPRPARDVDVMDLTESLGQLASPSRQRGRKRKSSELELGDTRSFSRNQPQAQPNGALPLASQQSFTAIDEIMNETTDPPPPYSTIASRPASPAQNVESSSTLGAFQQAGIDDSNKDHDGRLMNLAQKTSDRGHPVMSYSPQQKHPSISTPQPAKENAFSASLSHFLALSKYQIKQVIEKSKAHHESLVEAVFNLLEADDDDAELQEDLERSSKRCDALFTLSSKRDAYHRLTEEKEHTAAALKHAIRTRQGLEDAKAAHSACKAKFQQVEAECLSCFEICQKDVEAYIELLNHQGPSERQKKIAVHSTQALALPQQGIESAAPSSSRIVQTQVAKIHKLPSDLIDTMQKPLDAGHDDASNIEAYFSPPRKRAANFSNTGRRAHPTFEMVRDPDPIANDIDEFGNEDMATGEINLFSNRMGTPPAPYLDQDEDDFGMNDDDEMLELVEDVENRGVTQGTMRQIGGRSVFAELPNNSQRTSTSAKKTKKAFAKPDDPNMEELFRFSWSIDVKKTLKERFRLKGFRQNQLQAINATLGGKDTFVLMPTGGGKSLCYQLPALIQSGKTIGVTVVVSPLLSLMEDQVQHLRNLQIQAFLINGETKPEERNAIFEALNERDVETYVQLLYITPEMLAKSSNLTNKLEKLYHRQRLARLVIDEAHCVSQWGHDFRPDYKQIGDVRRKFPEVPVMALTATATENVKVDTIHNLSIKGCEVYTQSFNRANLYYEVREKAKGKADIQEIANLINEKHSKQTGIIYCFSKKDCEDIAKTLREHHSIKAQHYHAGLKPEEKSQVQKQWQASKVHVIVATIAFGMGIDKPDVRFVVHHTIPKSLEGYYQETGRAGRDQKPSGCYLFYGYKDAGKIRRMIDDGEGSWDQIQRQRQMFRNMIQYCENRSDCRRVQVLRYFSEKFHRDECDGGCDNCNSTSTFETVDFTLYARKAIHLVRQIASDKVTLQHCIDVFSGSKSKKVAEKGHDTLKECGAGNDLDREDIERLFSRLLSDEVLKEANVVNKMGFANQYVELGRQSNRFDQGKTQLEMQVRTSPRGKQKTAGKKASKVDHITEQRRKIKKAAGLMTNDDLQYAEDERYPMSTNVSSPIQAASTRKQAKQPVRGEVHNNGYYRDDFVISDPEDGNYAEADDGSSSDGFEPVRVHNEPQTKRARTAGPPIKSDRVMEDLDETHRDIVGNFVMTAREIVRKITLDKSLSTVPFTDTMLRAMAINFTETEEKMLQIPGINPERVRLYGKHLYKDITKCRQFYEDLQADRPDPNDRNVIDLVSDDEDEYGSIGSSDFEDDDDDGEPSAYFHPTKEVEAFNARFALSQSAAMRESANSAPSRKAPPKSKKRSYRATASAGTATGRRYAGGPRQTSKSYNGYGGQPSGSKKKTAGNRQNGGSNRGGGFVSRGRRVGSHSRGGGISAMPT